jgi:hypothetical protein
LTGRPPATPASFTCRTPRRQEVEVREGRVIFQSRLGLGRPARTYLVRIVVDVDRRPAEVVTVYRTTKIAKYWRR